MTQLTANDLKTKGISAIEVILANQPEAMISVRGKERFVVMGVAQYHYLRECELDAALAQSRADIAAGRFVAETADQHMARLEGMLATEAATKKIRESKSVIPQCHFNSFSPRSTPSKPCASSNVPPS